MLPFFSESNMVPRKLTSFFMPPFRKSDTEYSSLSETENFLPTNSILNEKDVVNRHNKRVFLEYKYSLPWAISTLFFASLSLVFWLHLPPNSRLGSFEKGFATELGKDDYLGENASKTARFCNKLVWC
jgi:hypothetical protein